MQNESVHDDEDGAANELSEEVSTWPILTPAACASFEQSIQDNPEGLTTRIQQIDKTNPVVSSLIMAYAEMFEDEANKELLTLAMVCMYSVLKHQFDGDAMSRHFRDIKDAA